MEKLNKVDLLFEAICEVLLEYFVIWIVLYLAAWYYCGFFAASVITVLIASACIWMAVATKVRHKVEHIK